MKEMSNTAPSVKPTFDLQGFPQDFQPLVVVVGDRREPRPKSIGDVLAYSVSTIDFMFLAELHLGCVNK